MCTSTTDCNGSHMVLCFMILAFGAPSTLLRRCKGGKTGCVYISYCLLRPQVPRGSQRDTETGGKGHHIDPLIQNGNPDNDTLFLSFGVLSPDNVPLSSIDAPRVLLRLGGIYRCYPLTANEGQGPWKTTPALDRRPLGRTFPCRGRSHNVLFYSTGDPRPCSHEYFENRVVS